MQSGDILLFYRGGLMSKIIQWGTKSKYSHTALCVNAEMNLLIEAQGCVRAADIRTMTDYDIFRVKEGHAYDLEKVVSFLVSKLNSRYDYRGVIFLGIMKLFRLKKMANKWQRKKDWFCSELVVSAFREGGLDIISKKAENASPKDIAVSKIVFKVS